MGFYKEPTDCFIEVTNHFVGLEAVLFSYSPGLRDLHIALHKETRYFLIKFVGVNHVQTSTRWVFSKLRITYEKGKNGGYKILDQDCLEIVCKNFMVIELLNGQEVIGI
jgi:hypothetical protein